jgi:hypothetical protein
MTLEFVDDVFLHPQVASKPIHLVDDQHIELTIVGKGFDLGEVGAFVALSRAADILGLDDAGDAVALVGAIAFHAVDLLGDRHRIRRFLEGLAGEQNGAFHPSRREGWPWR